MAKREGSPPSEKLNKRVPLAGSRLMSPSFPVLDGALIDASVPPIVAVSGPAPCGPKQDALEKRPLGVKDRTPGSG